MRDESDHDEEELPDPEESFKQMKEAYQSDDPLSIDKEREYFEYCSAVMKCWKDDLKKREKKKT